MITAACDRKWGYPENRMKCHKSMATCTRYVCADVYIEICDRIAHDIFFTSPIYPRSTEERPYTPQNTERGSLEFGNRIGFNS